MFRVKLALIIGGAVVVFFGFQEFRLTGVANAEPTIISCADLVANGYGDNAHVTISDFLTSDEYVVEESSKGGSWSKVWIPILPIDGEYHKAVLAVLDPKGEPTGPLPKPKNVTIIALFDDIDGERDLEQVDARDSLTGVIINEIDSLGSEERKILEDSYPNVNFDKCHILEVGRGAPTMAKAGGMMLGGLVLAGAGIGLFVMGKKKRA